MEAAIHIYIASFSGPLPPDRFLHLLGSLSPKEQGKINRFKRWQDAHASLYGKLLLQRAMSDLRIPPMELQYTKYDKPFFDAPFDFNISHSGNCVACAVSDTVRVGVDVELVKDMNLDDFSSFFTQMEMEAIAGSPAPAAEFFKVWTRKEAVIKADGGGLNLDLRQIYALADIVPLNGINWHLQAVAAPLGYVLHVCSDRVAQVLVNNVVIE